MWHMWIKKKILNRYDTSQDICQERPLKYLIFCVFGDTDSCNACRDALAITQKQLERCMRAIVKAYKYFLKRNSPLAEVIPPRM